MDGRSSRQGRKVDLRISDGERERYTEIYGMDPLASGGWLTLRLKHQLAILGCDVTPDFDLLGVSDDGPVVAPMTRGRATAQIVKKRDRDASVFSVLVKWS
jgi:hypothetical protein